MMQPAPRAPGPIERLSPAGQWVILVAGSAALAALLELLGLPAALLLGPMIAGIALATNGGGIRVPGLPALAAQALVGCLVARAITADIVLAFWRDWPLLVGVVLVIVATGGVLGWAMARYDVLPGTTAVWGTAPGAAPVMMVLAGDFGADPRLVAFMQYMRVVVVAGLASVVGRLWIGPESAAADFAWFPPMPLEGLAATAVVAGSGIAAGLFLRISGAPLLVPMILGASLEASGVVHMTTPPWLLALSYALLGWGVGLGFTRAILAHARRALPQVLLAILVMVTVSGVLAFILVQAAGVDPLTAYFATTPGGLDTVAVIAASSRVDLSFVMALQTVRFVIVLFAGPPLARFIAHRTG
jgi:membrane AbrB-like protein